MRGIARALAALALAALALVVPAAVPAHALEGPWAEGRDVRARLVAAVDGTGDRADLPLGLEVTMRPGWKTYWRTPGDAGLPPRLDWAGSVNLATGDLRYPVPHRFTLFGLETFGYDGTVLFPFAARAAEPGRPVDLRLGLDLLVCAEICVPERLDLALRLPAGPATPDPAVANRLARAIATLPGDGRAHGLEIRAVGAGGPADRPEIVVVATAREPFATPDVFVEPVDPAVRILFGQPSVRFEDGDRTAVVRLPVTERGPGVSLADLPVVLTLADGARSMEAPATVAATDPAPGGDIGLWVAMLAAALLGGLILNLMPCVLPVLSMKLASAAGYAGAERGAVRAGFLASAAGILVAFWMLAAAVAAFRLAGVSVGWGLQFQSPLFLAGMTAVVVLFAANLAGLFEVPLPRALADAGARGTGERPTLAGHFATGMFATLLATPCSAPFLGTAVGFALSRGPVEIAAVFTALGIGLALPYLAVAAVPSAARLLPRPGRWMATLRRVLAVPLALTAVWLVTVLAASAGETAAAAVATAMVAFVALMALRRRQSQPGARRLAGGAAALVLLGAFAAPAALGERAGEGRIVSGGTIPWRSFDRAGIAAEVAAGRVVFVDVTAEWCVTCRVNERFVLERPAVAGALRADGVTAMQADWTRPDPAIAAYLQAHGRYGIPFYAVYGPGAPQGVLLGEIVTEGSVLAALAAAR
jgi:suppressor for copper-sensitivity B